MHLTISGWLVPHKMPHKRSACSSRDAVLCVGEPASSAELLCQHDRKRISLALLEGCQGPLAYLYCPKFVAKRGLLRRLRGVRLRANVSVLDVCKRGPPRCRDPMRAFHAVLLAAAPAAHEESARSGHCRVERKIFPVSRVLLNSRGIAAGPSSILLPYRLWTVAGPYPSGRFKAMQRACINAVFVVRKSMEGAHLLLIVWY